MTASFLNKLRVASSPVILIYKHIHCGTKKFPLKKVVGDDKDAASIQNATASTTIS